MINHTKRDWDERCTCKRWAKPDVLHIEANQEHHHTYVSHTSIAWNDAPTEFTVELEVDGETSWYTSEQARQLAAILLREADAIDEVEKVYKVLEQFQAVSGDDLCL